MATVRKHGKNWQAMVRRKGFKPQSKSFRLKSDAESWATVIESELVRGSFVDTQTAASTSFEDCLLRYEQEQETAGRRSMVQLRSQLNLIRRSDLIHLSLANVSPQDIVKYKDARMATGIKAATCIKDINLLHTIFEVIQKSWAITLPRGNPVKLVSLPKHTTPTSRNRRLLPDEEERLLSALYTGSHQTAIIVRFGLATGMRRGEIMNIEFGHLTGKEKSTLYIPQTKTDHPREIPLSSGAHAAIMDRVHMLLDEGYTNIPNEDLITFKLFDIRADSVTRAFSRACKRAGIHNLTFHDLRHEAISRLFEKGLDMMEVSHISGHKGFDMLKKYTHLKPESLVEKLG